MDKLKHFQFNVSDAIVIFLYLALIVFFIYKLASYHRNFISLFAIVALVHTAMTIYYVVYATSNGTDAYRYFIYFIENEYINPLNIISASTNLINVITYPLQGFFKMSMWGATFVYSSISLTGYYLLVLISINLSYKLGLYNINEKSYWVLFLPMLHFFTLPIGKDSLIFLSIILTIYGIVFRKYGFLIFGLVGVGMVRPHIFIFFIVGIAISTVFFNKNFPLFAKIFILLFGVAGVSLALPFFMDRLMIDKVSIEEVGSTIDKFSKYNQGAESSVNLADQNIVVKILSYLFRPLFFDARSLLQIIASFENLFWIYMIFAIIRKARRLFVTELRSISITLISTGLITLLALASIVNNLGLAMRQKAMLFPFVFVLFFIATNKFKKSSNIKVTKV